MSGKYTLQGENLKKALKMLSDVTSIFENADIKYSVTAGTLLGIVRENRLLPWDKDMDLRVFYQDSEKILNSIKAIRKAGYIVRIRYQEKDDPPLKKGDVRLLKLYSRKFLLFKGEVMMDCFIATKLNDQYIWSCGGERKYTKKAVPSHYYDNLEKVTFEGEEYYLPVERKDYLKFRYGDWQTPKKKWRFTKDDLSIISTDHKPKEKMNLAVFLLAGGGIRLKPYTNDIPKCLVEVNGKKLLIRMFDYLEKGGIEKVILVIGYKGEKIRSVVGNSWNGMEIVYVNNRDWATTNNVVSLNLAVPLIDGDFILLEGDLIFTCEAFNPLFEPDRIAVDKYQKYMDGTLVDIDDSQIVTRFLLNKDLSEDEKIDFYKTVNLYSFKYDSFKKLILPQLNDLINSGQKQVYYEQAIANAVALSDYKTTAVSFSGTPWYEIDTEDDLYKAEELFRETNI